MKSVHIRLKNKLEDVFVVEPNDLGVGLLTKAYKMITAPLKTIPFIVIVPVSIIVACLLYFLSSFLLIKIVSFLQYGF